MHRSLSITETIYTLKQLSATPPEAQIAFAGRSNVGKSSLINCLGGAKKLAKISSKPGKTRSINFYSIHPGDYYLVDLPGYGYARASKTERDKWATLIERYLTKTPKLQAVVSLLDCRLEPQQLDLDLTAYVQQLGIKLIPVLTKADKCKLRDCSARQRQWQDILRIPEPPLLFSSRTGSGRVKLWNILDDTVGFIYEPKKK